MDEDLPEPPPPEPALTEPEALPAKHVRKFPQKYDDSIVAIPSANLTNLAHFPPRPKTARQLAQEHLDELAAYALEHPEPPAPPTPPPEPKPMVFRTEPDSFGLYREYPVEPTLVPTATLKKLIDACSLQQPNQPTHPPNKLASGLGKKTGPGEGLWEPFLNPADLALMEFYWTGSAMKSAADVKMLTEKFEDPHLLKEDVAKFNLDRETRRLEEWDAPNQLNGDGWKESSVKI